MAQYLAHSGYKANTRFLELLLQQRKKTGNKVNPLGRNL